VVMASEALSYHHLAVKATPTPAEPLLPPLLIEFIGTFFLIFTICLQDGEADFRRGDTVPLPPLAIGSVLMVMIFMGGHISGAHYNPAVTLGVFIRGKIRARKAVFYVLVQLVAAFLAALLAYWLTDAHPVPARGKTYSPGAALSAEFLYTFALVSVVLNVATTASQEDNSFFGFAIGFTVLAGAFSVGDISGGALNPAVGTGMILVHMIAGGDGENLWIYWLGPLLGGLVAGLVFRVTNVREYTGAIRLGGDDSLLASASMPLITERSSLSDAASPA